MKSILEKNQKGFTLVETLVAVAIFASAITGLIAITAGGVANTNFVKNKFVAGYLAMEGAELVRNIRDTVSVSNPNATWTEVLSNLDECMSPNYCYIDSVLNTPPALCDGEDCPYLTYQESTGEFGYRPIDNSDYFQSIFRRKIQVENIPSADSTNPISEIKVTSVVDWMQTTRSHSVKYSFNLKNWTNP